MTKYLNFFESESGFTEAVEAGQLYYPNVSYTEEDDTVHWNLARSVETPMLRMSFSTSGNGETLQLHKAGVVAIEIDGTAVNVDSGGTYTIPSSGDHTVTYQFSSDTIPNEAFYVYNHNDFSAFTSAVITSAVTSIGFWSFATCSGLTSVTIPDSVTTIGQNAFSYCSIRYLFIPDSVTAMGNSSFAACSGLQTVMIGSGVTSIGSGTFADIPSLQSVVLPDSLTAIGEGAFTFCTGLYDVTIPSGVTAIGQGAFKYCSGLTAIYVNPQVPPTLGSSAFNYTNDCPIYVPAASVEAYKQSWSAYASRIMPKHRISASVNDEDKGEVMLYQETAPEGDQVEFHVDVFDSDGYQVSNVTVTDGNGDEVEYTDEDYGEGLFHYTFTMPASDVTISVVIGEKGRYKISTVLNDDSLGEVEFHNGKTANEGDQVDFDVNVFDSNANQVTSVTVTDGNGDEVECTVKDYGGGVLHHYTFTMPASDVTISVVIEAKQ